MAIDRVISSTVEDELEGALIEIMALPRHYRRADALVIVTGQLERGRFSAIEPWNKRTTNARYLLVAGQNKEEREREWIDLERLQAAPYNLRRTEGVIVEPCALHTRDQTDWVARQVIKERITSVAPYAAAYHLSRVVMAMIKSFLLHNIWIPIFPMPAPADLSLISAFSGRPMRSFLAGERKRRHDYVRNGEIASPKEVVYYLDRTRHLYPATDSTPHHQSLLALE